VVEDRYKEWIAEISGKSWRVSSKPAFVSEDSQHNPVVLWAYGWEEMSESPDTAVAKAQAELRHTASQWEQIRKMQPTPSPPQ